jgi:hypothetical protein
LGVYSLSNFGNYSLNTSIDPPPSLIGVGRQHYLFIEILMFDIQFDNNTKIVNSSALTTFGNSSQSTSILLNNNISRLISRKSSGGKTPDPLLEEGLKVFFNKAQTLKVYGIKTY